MKWFLVFFRIFYPLSPKSLSDEFRHRFDTILGGIDFLLVNVLMPCLQFRIELMSISRDRIHCSFSQTQSTIIEKWHTQRKKNQELIRHSHIGCCLFSLIVSNDLKLGQNHNKWFYQIATQNSRHRDSLIKWTSIDVLLLTPASHAKTLNDFAAYGPIGTVMAKKCNKTTDTSKFIASFGKLDWHALSKYGKNSN